MLTATTTDVNGTREGVFASVHDPSHPTNAFERTRAMSSPSHDNNETASSVALTTAMERLKSALRTRVDENTATRAEVESCSDELDELMMAVDQASEATGVDAEGARVLARARQARQTYKDVLVRGPSLDSVLNTDS